MQTWLESRNAKLFESRKCAKIERMLVDLSRVYKGDRVNCANEVSYANEGRSFECSWTRVSERVAPGIVIRWSGIRAWLRGKGRNVNVFGKGRTSSE